MFGSGRGMVVDLGGVSCIERGEANGVLVHRTDKKQSFRDKVTAVDDILAADARG